MRKRSTTFVLATLFLLVASFASAATFVVPTDRILVQRADAIVVGTVLGSHSAELPEGGIVTYTDISVQEVIKGRVSTRTLRLTDPGGKVGDRITMIPGVPHYQAGKQSLFFLNGAEGRGWGTTDFVVGKFDFASDINNIRVLVREEHEIVGWDLKGNTFEDVRRHADRFLHFVREESAGRMAPVDYVLPKTQLRMSAEEISAKAVGTPLTYSMTEGGGTNSTPGFRWSTFASGGTVNWVAENQASANPAAGQSGITNGLASWTNDCPSNVRYSFVGLDATATANLNAADNKNGVHFDTNLNTAFYGFRSPFVCGAGGTIALGGVTIADAPHAHPVSGESFYTILEGDVDVNVGVGSCNSFLTNEMWNTGMAHEIGHTLGFRHSNTDRVGAACPGGSFDCSNSAVMFAAILGGFNGALQTWDLNAVRIVYPGESCLKPRGDFNGDGRSDIFWRDPTSGSNATWLMTAFVANGAGTTTIDPSYQVAGTGDFDGDGKADLVWRNQATGANYIWLMNGHHASNGSPFTSVPPPWVISGVGDVDADGRADIVWHNPANGANTIWLMNGFAVVNGSSIATVPDTNFNIVAVNDFSGDGKADLLWRNSVTGQNHMWLLNGLTVQATSSISTVGDLNYYVAGTGDFNGDARADILWMNDVTGQMYIWQVDGFSQNGAPLPLIGDTNWRPRAVGDWDADGKYDIMFRNVSNGSNYLWFMNGFSVVNGGPIPTVPALTWNPQVPK